MREIFDYMNQVREEGGYLTLPELVELGQTNTLYDPFSTLISRDVVIGSENAFYPGTHIRQSDGARIAIGDANVFGPESCTIIANKPDTAITIGNYGRFEGARIIGNNTLGDGCQILGRITIQGCTLEGGGGFDEPDPDLRGAVLKGVGTARNITIGRGRVMNGRAGLPGVPIEWQRDYHPKPTS